MKKSSFILSALLLASALFTVGCSLNAKSEPIPFKSNYDKVQYKMVCYFQDIGSPSYSINKKYTKTYSGKPGELTQVVPPAVEGFTLQAEPTQVPIAGDYTTVVEVTYNRNFYYVHYDTNGGNTMYSSFFQYGSKVNITQKPVRNGYTFTGWTPEIPATMPAHDITLKAQWIEGEATPYKVEHYLQNADNNFYTLDFTDDKAGRTNSQTKAAAKKYPNFTAQPFNQESISPEGDTVVLIFYNRNTFTIEFDTDGGSTIAPAEYKFEQTVTPPADPTKDLYLFKEWTPELPATMPDEDIEVKAVWEQPTYTITYKDQNNNDFSGTLGTNTPTTHTYGTATTLVSPTKTGYNFDGWYLDSACANSIVTALTATGYTSDITIYAKFTPKQFTITYNLDGGTNPMGTPTTHTYGTATTLPTPIKTGYLFKGWYTTSGFSDTALTTLAATSYTSDITLYAKFTGKQFTITYNLNGGTNPTDAPATHTYGTATTLPTPTRTGYNFEGWYLDSACAQNGITTLTATGYTSDITIYAKFTPKQFTITYNLNGGTNPTDAPATHTYGTATTLPTPTRTGYIFDGWYSSSTFTGSALTTLGATSYTTVITLYAHWVTGKLIGTSTQKQGDVAKTGLTINGTTIPKTSEIVVIPQGMQAVMSMADDSSYSGYIGGSTDINDKGVYLSGRKVKLSSFIMAQYPVTQDLYYAVMGTSPSTATTNGTQGQNPVNYVNWFDAIIFCNRLSKLEGLNPVYSYTIDGKAETDPDKWLASSTLGAVPTSSSSTNYTTWRDGVKIDITKNGYRLPTEAEWEYAARGGDPTAAAWKYAFSGIDIAEGNTILMSDGSWLRRDSNLALVAQYAGSSTSGTYAVGHYSPNTLNLYDMSGNVWEWCNDFYNSAPTYNDSSYTVDGYVTDPLGAASSSYRIRRGGSWVSLANYCSVSYREGYAPDSRGSNFGFRLCRSSSN